MNFTQRIPTILGLLAVTVVVAGVIAFSELVLRRDTAASQSGAPIDVRVSNISDSLFTVSWLTADPATGTVQASPVKGKKITGFDDRDVNGKLGKYTSHSVTIRSAAAQTDYTLTVISAGRSYKNPTYRSTTGPAISGSTNGLEPAYGNIVDETGQPAEGALIYLTLEGGQLLSTLVKSSGSWLIPLNAARTVDLQSYLTPVADRISEDFSVYHNGKQTIATSDTLNDSPLPQMTIGQTYDFRRMQAKAINGSQKLAANPAPTVRPAVLGQQTSAPKSYPVAISAPAQNGAVASTRPNISGTGVPGKPVTVTVGITRPQSGVVAVGDDGIWRFTVTEPVGIGRQSVTITTADNFGNTVAITHMFEILKSGTQVLGDATPSATLEPTPGPTAEITPTPDLAGQPVPTTGYELPTILLTVIGMILLVGGVMTVAR